MRYKMSIPSIASSVSFASSASMSSSSPSNEQIIYNRDVFDDFIEVFYNCHIKVQNVLLETIINYIKHPAYAHLLRTMNKDNACYVIGYLRSQRSFELYTILERIMMNPLPTKEDFIQNTYMLQ
jgi:hypothetical protein